MLYLCLWCNLSCWTGPSHHVLRRQVGLLFHHLLSGVIIWHVIFMLIKPKTSIKFLGKVHVERLWWFPMWYSSLYYLSNVEGSLFTYLTVFFYLYWEERLREEKPEFCHCFYLIRIWAASFLRSSVQICNIFFPTILSGTRSGTSLVCVEWNNLNLMSPKNFTGHFLVWRQLTKQLRMFEKFSLYLLF